MVEDSEDDAELIRLEMRRASYEVEWRRVDTEPEFVDALNDDWDLIISDYHMPRFDGLRAFRLYKERGIDTPFLFVSGALGEERAVEAMRAGARDYLIKGNLGRLNAAVRRELAEAQNRQSRRVAEESAERGQRRLAMAVEASGAGVFEYRIPADADTYVGERFAEILGYGLDDLPSDGQLLTWLFDRVHEEDLADVRAAYERFVVGKSERYAVEMRLRHRQGRWIDVSASAKAVDRHPDGTAARVVGVLVDVSEHRRLEIQFRQAQKMEAIGRLAGGVAHDFNNLLTAILSFGGFALQEIPEGHPAHDDIREIIASARRAENLTAQLLAFSRRQPIRPKVLSVNDLVTNMDRMLRRVVGEDVVVSTVLEPNAWNVRVDPGSLEQVVANLAVNARDAMPLGGKLIIETQNARLDETYGMEHGVKVRPGDYVLLAVSDTGSGMDAQTQAQVFEPFFTTKEAGKGTGLGLSTCYGIVKQASGYLWVYSELGRGTTFKIYLPRVAEEEEPARAVRDRLVGGGCEKILVAEDDEQIRRIIVRVLGALGYDVATATNGREALSVAEEAGEAIDLVLTDVVMPEMSGQQLVEALKERRPDLKVIFMSGYTPNSIVHRGEIEAGVPMIQKPFTPELLAIRIREVLDA